MGCITSTKKLNDTNVFKVVRVLPSSPTVHCGYLELTPRELIFVSSGQERIIWALQHLRRYGLNGDLFSFEAGRRCMTGPGIYTFRCHQAEVLYSLFQRYINAVNTDAFALADRERANSTHNILTRAAEPNTHSNNYLEPAPLTASNGSSNGLNNARNTQNDMLTLELDSPVSLPGLPINSDELSPTQTQSPNTPGTYINTNIYFDQPALRTLQEYNNNSATGTHSSLTSTGTCSAFSTIKRRTLIKGCSLDVPPQETAPMLSASTTDALHMYANIDTPGACSITRSMHFDNVERCYENLNRRDLPLLLQTPPTSKQQTQQQQPKSPQVATPTTPTSSNSVGCINYIELDLDPPRSPSAQNSPKSCSSNEPNFQSNGLTIEKKTLSLPHTKTKLPTVAENPTILTPNLTPASNSSMDMVPTINMNATTTTSNVIDATTALTTTNTTSTMPSMKSKKLMTKPTETALSYSTIDFIKTCALIKSSTHDTDFVEHRRQLHDADELRITRHSKCVRKSYSISE